MKTNADGYVSEYLQGVHDISAYSNTHIPLYTHVYTYTYTHTIHTYMTFSAVQSTCYEDIQHSSVPLVGSDHHVCNGFLQCVYDISEYTNTHISIYIYTYTHLHLYYVYTHFHLWIHIHIPAICAHYRVAKTYRIP